MERFEDYIYEVDKRNLPSVCLVKKFRYKEDGKGIFFIKLKNFNYTQNKQLKEKVSNPFLIYCNDEIAGFVLLNSGKYVPKDAEYSIHEIFILKSFRGKGVATIAVKKLFEMYTGKYKIAQLEDNKLAISFWKGFYKKQNIAYEEKVEVIDGFNGYIQLFNS